MGPRRHRRPSGQARRLVALLIAGAGGACVPVADGNVGPTTTDQWPGVPPDAVRAQVLRVIDGDSVRVAVDGDTVDVRLAGVNAPEGDECHGDDARDTLDRLLADEVDLVLTDTDRFGRAIAEIWSDGEFVNGSLVTTGDAIALTLDVPWFDAVLAAQDVAQTSGHGLWAPDACGEDIDLPLHLEMTRPDPPGPDEEALADEVVTIVNEGPDALDLSFFVLRDESTANRLILPAGTSIPAFDSLAVSSGCDAAGTSWCTGTPIWNNGGDTAILQTAAGTVIAHTRHHP